MAPPRLLIFDDGRGDFGPLTDLRPVFDLRTGARTTRQRIERALGLGAAALHVPAALRDLTAQANPGLAVNAPPAPGDWLLVNGRLTAGFPWPQHGPAAGAPIALGPDEEVLCAWLDHQQARAFLESGCRSAGLGVPQTRLDTGRRLLLERPWHILDALDANLRWDLAHSDQTPLPVDAPGVHVLGAGSVNVANARLLPGVVLNAEAGPIEIGADTVVGAGTVIEGPAWIGEHVFVAAQTYLRGDTVIGPHCKVGGEVSASVMQGLSNKVHFGYLGNALVGEWVNLGAGTTVSNLKNTYGLVRVALRPGEPAQDTGRQLQGPIIGDFVRTAIGSRLLTGSCLGTGTMLALSGLAPKVTPPFGFHTDEHPAGVAHDPERFLATARAMFARRQRALSPALEARLRTLQGAG